jgi:rhamnogalacturonyl hydrolase YesR
VQKKALILVIVLSLLLSLPVCTGCGSSTNDHSEPDNGSTEDNEAPDSDTQDGDAEDGGMEDGDTGHDDEGADGGDGAEDEPITPVSENHAPTVSINEGSVTVANGAPQTFTANVFDEDGDTLTYKWHVDGNEQTGETSSTFVFSATPVEEATYAIRVVVSDGEYAANASVTLTVQAPTVPTLPDPGLQASVIAARYMDGEYPDVIDDAPGQPYAIYLWDYPTGVTLWAFLLLHEQTGNPAYLSQVRASLEYYDVAGLMRVDGGYEPIDYVGAMAHAILEYSLRSGDHRFLDDALEAAHYFLEEVARTPEGLIASHAGAEAGRIWADAVFMVAPLMAKAGRLLDDDAYYDDVLEQFRWFTEKLRDPDVGLYHQGWNYYGAGASPGFWGRANGWVAIAMTEVLDTIPEDYTGRDELLALYQDFTRAIIENQDASGMWHQLLNRPYSYEETSCTAMFIYALAQGVQHGWLDEDCIDAIESGYLGLLGMISPDGDIDNICPGTGTQQSEEDYLNRVPQLNDNHGIGPVLLAMYAMMNIQ